MNRTQIMVAATVATVFVAVAIAVWIVTRVRTRAATEADLFTNGAATGQTPIAAAARANLRAGQVGWDGHRTDNVVYLSDVGIVRGEA